MLNLSHYKYFSAACLKLQHRNRSQADTRVLKNYPVVLLRPLLLLLEELCFFKALIIFVGFALSGKEKKIAKLGRLLCMREML